mmetsp:Transcript_10152/g.13310  ORF Transcript_10152/g.13310 Transcript_10152/m.13310 type:complete len:1211 (-) Transcript_10152:695-4327(-)
MTDGWTEKSTIDGLPYYYNVDTEEITWDKPDALRTAQEIEEESGEWTWVPHPKQLWQPARILSRNSDGTVTTQTQTGKEIVIPAGGVVEGALTGGRKVKVELWPLKIASLKRAEEDLVRLPALNDAAIINNIRIRYEKDELYTWVGASRSVLISVNPFKSLPLYGSKQIQLYKQPPPNTHLAPHTYDIAKDSYESLLFEGKNQSILISGESGAGKTVCTKQCLNYLAEVAGSESDIEEKILAANPVLEAFGNAQTIRNNNSSRFGKWIEVYVDPVESCIVSSKIINYLLEKSRLVYQQSGERNYHIFYQLTKDSGIRSKYGVSTADNYRYTNQSGVYDAHLIDDAREFVEVQEAMDMLKFSDEEKDWVLSLTCGILTLGNVTFKAKKEKGGVSGSQVDDASIVQAAASLIGVGAEELQHVLNFRSITVRGQKATIPLDPEKARSGCDSLAMGVYGRLFDWLVRKINVSLEGTRGKFIGILDIFGFEIFEQNSFEQLCINFANEKLQQQFNRTTFKEEEALYIAEGINYTHIDFIDNQVVLDMIEKTPQGILPMLDDECKVPEGADSKFMTKIEDIHSRNDRFQTDTHRKLQDSYNFEILHYAGIVKYNGEGFMVKNTDNLFQDMYNMCANSEVAQMKELFPKTENRRQMKSLSYQFRQQLNELMGVLYETDSRYIRCVKPNSAQKPDQFESGMSIDQLRYSGVFEAVDIRKQGYPFRYKFAQFACRYACINKGHRYRAGKRDYKAKCQELLDVNKQEFQDVVFGKTMVLYRTAEHSTLELLRNLALETVIPKMQAVMRGHLAREMKRRCFKLRDGIDAALRKRNDLDALIAAIDAVDPTIAHMKKIFPGVLPLNLEKGKKHRDDLQKWRDLEGVLENLLQKDANDVYYDLAEATDRADDLRDIPQTDKQIGLVEEAHAARANCDRGVIDNEAKDCLAVLDPDRMQAVVEKASTIPGHTSKELQEIERLLALEPIEFVQLEIKKAEEMGDERRRIHRTIRYKELYVEKHASEYYPFSSYDNLRNPMDYAKASFMAKFMGAEKKASQMLTYTKAASITSLTLITGDPQKVKTAKLISKCVRQYMGEKKFQTPDEAARQAVQLANANGLQDELLLQVMKQLCENETESLERGWHLFGYALLNVRPSEEFEYYVHVFLRKNAPENDYKRYTALMNTLEFGGPVASVSEAVRIITEGNGRSRFSISAEEPTGPSQ